MTTCQLSPSANPDLCNADPTAEHKAVQITNFLEHPYNVIFNALHIHLHLGLVPFFSTVLIAALLTPVLLVVLDYLDFRRLRRIPMVLLELTLPSMTTKSAHATDQLFSVLHDLYGSSWLDRLLHRKQAFACEIVSTREAGIRFLVRIPENSVAAFASTVSSYVRDIQFKQVEDYLPGVTLYSRRMRMLEFKQSRHFVFPLKVHDALSQHDPVAYITGALAKPEPGELLAFQVVLSSASSREANRVRNKLLVGKQPGIIEFSWKLPFKLLRKILDALVAILEAILEGIGDMTRPSYKSIGSYDYSRSMALPTTKAHQALIDKQLAKLAQPLFRADIRALIVVNESYELQERATGIASSLASFRDPGYQGLVPRGNLFLLSHWKRWWQYRLFKFANRLPSMLTTTFCLLSADEVSSIYHFPYGYVNQSENLVKSYSKTLAASPAMKRHADATDFDVVLGVNKYHGADTAIGLTADERQRHVYIIGGTGNGKTTMMEYAIVQDIRKGKGAAIIDPHGDSAQKLLGYIPEERIKDVIYLNPRDLDHPIGLNLLELPEGLSGSDLAHEQDLVAEAVISVLRKVFDDNTDANAYRIERVLRNAIHTAFTVEGATVFTVLQLLTDAAYRRKVTNKLPPGSLKRFWKEELGRAGEFQRVKISSGPITRIERYERSEAARRILGQSKSTINFDNIMNSGKILICNFSKGRLGEDTSTLFGVTILAKLQLATWHREDIPEAKRRPFYLYVDEFQNFASESFMGLFSEARKYKLFVTMAQQSVAQLREEGMLNTILDNVGTMVAFRSKSPETERLLLHQFSPHVEHGEIGNLPSYHFYIKVTAVEPQEPLSGETIVLLRVNESEEVAEQVIDMSRRQYGVYVLNEATQPTRQEKNSRAKDEGAAEEVTKDAIETP